MTDKSTSLKNEAKRYVAAVLGIDLRAFSRTNDQAWVSFAARLLRQQA